MCLFTYKFEGLMIVEWIANEMRSPMMAIVDSKKEKAVFLVYL